MDFDQQGGELGKQLASGMAAGIQENSYLVSEEFKKLLADLKLQRELDIVNDEAYYKRLATLRDDYLERGTADWWKYTKEIIGYEKALVDEQKKQILSLYADIAAEAGKRADEVLYLQDKMAQRLQGYGKLYEQVSIHANGRTSSYTNLRDLSVDIRELEAYKNAIQAVKERGAPSEFLALLRDMNVSEGTLFANRLLREEPAAFSKYIEDWQKKQAATKQIASELYREETESVIKDLAQSLEQAGLMVPEGFFASGRTAAENFGIGFLEQMEGVMQKIERALLAGMASIIPSIAYTDGGISLGTNAGNTYQSIFQIGSSKNTAAEQIQAWKAATQIEKMRGGI